MTPVKDLRGLGARTTSILATAAMAAGVVVTAGVTAPPAQGAQATAARPVDAACGTWVLEQVSSATDLSRKSAAIDSACPRRVSRGCRCGSPGRCSRPT